MDELPPLKVGKGHSADADEESNFPKVQNYALMMKENLVRWGLMDSGDKSPFGWIDLRIALHKGIVRSETPLSSLGFPGDILEALRAIGIKTVGGLKSKGEALPLPQAVNGTSVSLLDEPSSLGPRIADHLGSIMPELAKKPRDRFDWISARYEEYCKKRTLAAKTTRS
jgi:hypothetical protein